MEQIHTHNGIDSQKLKARDALLDTPQAPVNTVTGSAGGTYTSDEQNLINNTKDSLNDLIVKLQAIGLIQ